MRNHKKKFTLCQKGIFMKNILSMLMLNYVLLEPDFKKNTILSPFLKLKKNKTFIIFNKLAILEHNFSF